METAHSCIFNNDPLSVVLKSRGVIWIIQRLESQGKQRAKKKALI